MREMKDSGIDTIGYVPSQWVETRLKYLCKIQTGDEDTQNANPEGKYPFFVRSPIVERCDRYTFEGEGILVAGDGAGAGRIFHHVFGKYAVHQRVYRLSDFSYNAKFIHYYLSNLFPAEMDKGSAQSTVPSMRLPMLLNFKFYLPSNDEAKKIVDYLDKKCTEIDTLTSDIQKQIDTLEQYKKSLVYMIVSKGIKKGVDLKETDSDVWNEIPCDWQIKDIKYLFEIVKRIAGKEGYDILSVTQRGLKVKDISNGEGQIAENYSGYQYVYPTDYVMNHMDLLTGWVDLSCQFGVTSPDYRVFRLRDKEKNSLDYYKYVMQCCYMNRIFYSLGQGVSNMGRWRLQTSAFNNFKVPVPPYQTQIEIAEYLNKKITDINAIIDLKRMQIGKITEYKKSLIYEYVTGKKEVM